MHLKIEVELYLVEEFRMVIVIQFLLEVSELQVLLLVLEHYGSKLRID